MFGGSGVSGEGLCLVVVCGLFWGELRTIPMVSMVVPVLVQPTV